MNRNYRHYDPVSSHRDEDLRYPCGFRQCYNTERPHEALGQQVPASLYEASRRPYPAALLPLTYPGHYEVRRVRRNGGFAGAITG